MLELPPYGTKVRITDDWSDYFKNHPSYVQRIYSTVGILIASENHDPPGTIRVSTGNQYHPNAVIPVIRIVKVEQLSIAPISAPKIKTEEISQFEIRGSKGDLYIVKVSGKQASCSCLGYKYSKSGECKHIKQIRTEHKLS